jgi:hypothetical protein
VETGLMMVWVGGEKEAAVERPLIAGVRKEARTQMPNGPPMQQRARTVRICEIRMARVVAMVRIMAARLTVMVRVMVRVKGAKATKATKAARIAIPTNTLAFAWSNTRGNEVLFQRRI